ncbi:MAG TPA: Rrf2 family transcriptional regulator [Bacteroidales bacterium]|nr:Rrf2 family transcriptional regulator [Bacteroidales bacterium]
MNSIINLSISASIAIHSMIIILKSKSTVNAKYITDITGFSQNHISKVLNILVKHQYLKSMRGPHGGFIIHPDKRDISLLEIYQIIEGNIEYNNCNLSQQCHFSECIFEGLMKQITYEFKNYLSNKKINNDFKLNI